MAEPRTAKQVIDQAIKENRRGEWLCYGFATAFVLAGLAVIGKSLLAEQSAWSTAIGAAVSALFWPAVNAARQIRRENLAIRLLEVPLSRAETAQAATVMLLRAMAQAIGPAGRMLIESLFLQPQAPAPSSE
ncbi:MAG TPA: hypothetical protein VJ739_02745 [Gemmataceae bacterium]|nr:hypothetical protein [Gemmataceae bacterium]